MPTAKTLSAMLGALLLAAPAAHASTVLFNESFDHENNGQSAADYQNLTGAMRVSGSIDLFKSGDGGVTCAGGVGSCIDLESSDSQAGRMLSDEFHFEAGDEITLTFDLSGSQRPDISNADEFRVDFLFSDVVSLTSFTRGGAFGSATQGPFDISNGFIGVVGDAFARTPFQRYSLSFVAASAGDVTVDFSSAATIFGPNNHAGPILDNVQLVTSADVVATPAPEPAVWSLMITGFGLAGTALRRRRFTAA